MKTKEQELDKQYQQISPLARDHTHGEKVYDVVFNQVINFWVNLFASAAFTYWVSHSHNAIKLPFTKKEFSSPMVLQKKMASGIEQLPFMRAFSDVAPGPGLASNRERYATNAANTLTLVTAGHPIIILSAWLGGKIKTPFVKFFDRQHYGVDAMEDPSIKARHALMEAGERPTLFGAVVGRLGTIVATQTVTYTVGNPNNAIKWLGGHVPGLKMFSSFPGMDRLAEVAGHKGGEVISTLAPNRAAKTDDFLRSKNYSWSNQQLENPKVDSTRPYDSAFEHMGKYLAQDVLYTAVTSTTISPAINLLKRVIPGMTYKPKVSAETQTIIDRAESRHLKPIPASRDAANENIAVANDEPAAKISLKNLQHNERIRASEPALATGITQ